MPNPPAWNEHARSEDPAVELLQSLGYTYIPPKTLESERESLKDVVLTSRLADALRRLNPWLSEANVKQAIRKVVRVSAASLLEANHTVYTALTYGVAFEQDRGEGRRSYTVRFFDFDEPKRNEWIVTRQYKVRGSKKDIIPDIVVFVNGLPLVVIECKSPTLGDSWKAEAVKQLRRYQEADDRWKQQGAPKLFETAQILIGTCGERAVYGTLATPERYYFEWKEPYPLNRRKLANKLGREPTAQDILLYGLLEPRNLLDIVRNFIVFDVEGGRTVRKLARYKQFMAVNKAMRRIRKARKSASRGGVIWHTQGSGKSLTMLWLALKLRRDQAQQQPTIVIVTDRTKLDSQIAAVFTSCGFPNPDRATSVRDLRGMLEHPTGKTVMTTIQKFQELDRPASGRRSTRTALADAANIFIMVDEAHRSQYQSLAAKMRQALPNACFLGFTGTPIDKKDRSTLRTFGSYIDTYTIEQSVQDGATVPIFYESRLPELQVVGQTVDHLFDRMFADRSDEERAAIKQRYATEQAIAGAPRRIEAICLNLRTLDKTNDSLGTRGRQDVRAPNDAKSLSLERRKAIIASPEPLSALPRTISFVLSCVLIEHFTEFIKPNRFKAQVVTTSRHAAVTYKETLDKLNGPESAVIMSANNNDEERLAKWHLTKQQQDVFIERFKNRDDPFSILIVCDMLLTGFDAPAEQVMYLDAPLREHGLLQAIARVNRPCGDDKTYGLVVDYWGVSTQLKAALDIFSTTDVNGALAPRDDELPRLESRHAAAMRIFQKVADRSDLDACVQFLEPEDVRAEFDLAFRRFSQSMDALLPDPRALRYRGDLGWLGKIRGAARARYRDNRLDLTGCGEKVRQLIESVVVADGIEILVKEVQIFSTEFDEKIDALKTDGAKASEMEHAIRHEINVRVDENPGYYQSLRERLEQIIKERREERIDAAHQLALLNGLREDLKGEKAQAQDIGLNPRAFAIYSLLQRRQPQGQVGEERATLGIGESTPNQPATDSTKRDLASQIDSAIVPFTGVVDWQHKDDEQRLMRRAIKKCLRQSGYDDDATIETLATEIVDLAKVRIDP